VIDPSANAVIAQWPTARPQPVPMASPSMPPAIVSFPRAPTASSLRSTPDQSTNQGSKAFPLKPLRSELLDLRRLIPIFSCIRYDIAI
jgi:hypothetical protein